MKLFYPINRPDPSSDVGKELVIEGFKLNIKYDNLRMVQDLWHFVELWDIVLDDDTIDMIEDYWLDARARRR